MPTSSNSAVECPRVAFTGRKVNYKKEFALNFMDYAEVYVSGVISNDVTKPRTVPCLALYPTGNANDSWVFFNMNTKRNLRSSNYTRMVTNELVIGFVDQMYLNDENFDIPVFEPDDPDLVPDDDFEDDDYTDTDDQDDHSDAHGR